MTALRRYARSFTGFERDARIFLVTTLVYGVALSLWWVDFNLYLVALDLDPAFIGIAATASSAAGVVFAFPAAILSDRIGRRLVLALGTGGATLGILGLLLTTEPVAILLCAAVVGAANQVYFVVQSPLLMERSRPEHRSELFSLQFAISNVTNVGAALLGGAIAAILGGAGAAAGSGAGDPSVFRVLLVVMAVAAALATVTVLALRDDRPRRRRDWQTLEQRPVDGWAGEPIAARHDAPPAAARRSARFGIPRPSDSRTFWRLLVPGFLISLGAGQVIPFLNVFIEGKFGLDLAALNVIFAITSLGTAIAIMIQPALARRFGKVGSVTLVQGASIPFLVVLGFSPILWTVIVAMAVRNSLMNAGNPIANAFAMEQLRPGERATYAATAGLLWSLGWVIAGPWYSILQRWLGFEAGYTVNFVTIVVLYSLGTWLYWHWFHDVETRQPADGERVTI
ncbi:MAG TPA: MFS transporter [Candidatus Nanopelagicales bacterium]|nr:MFS transporter [Candidatus Nanopelagicales bacterium]